MYTKYPTFFPSVCTTFTTLVVSAISPFIRPYIPTAHSSPLQSFKDTSDGSVSTTAVWYQDRCRGRLCVNSIFDITLTLNWWTGMGRGV
mmetsp:Transcript_100341/g.173363  ORF Transcript_100341/g.173363 Transcript_100341/m.173363 type:complete len:89 (+) Transcript_100341:1038-1304(+)